MRVAILGAGSLGTVIGAMLSKSGVNVVLIDGYDEHVRALNTKGAIVTGKLNLKSRVIAYPINKIEGEFDIVFYLGKAGNNDTYLPAILPHLHASSVVCTLQNGIPEEKVAVYVGKERTVGATVGWGASLISPGITEFTCDPDRQTYELGEIDGEVTPRIKKIKEILDFAGTARISDQLIAERWTKLCVNASFSGISAALGCTYGDILDNEQALFYAALAKDEVIKVAHAQGIKLLELQNINFEDFELIGKNADFTAKKDLFLRWYTPHRKTIASMLFDLRLGRKCEIDAINGVVVEKGSSLGIDTTINSIIVQLVQEAERTNILPSIAENIYKFPKL